MSYIIISRLKFFVSILQITLINIFTNEISS